MITSCHAAEGKSYLSINLMRTLAQRGIKVALVDADLRRSLVNSDYGLKYEDGRSDGKGLSHFLAGMVGMDEVIYQTDIPNAIMVPVGRDVPNPLALLTKTVWLPWIKLEKPDARLIRLSEKNNNWTFNLANDDNKDANAKPSAWSFRLDNICLLYTSPSPRDRG